MFYLKGSHKAQMKLLNAQQTFPLKKEVCEHAECQADVWLWEDLQILNECQPYICFQGNMNKCWNVERKFLSYMAKRGHTE